MSSGSNHGSFLVSVTDADRLRNIYRMALEEVVKSRRIWENRLPGVVPRRQLSVMSCQVGPMLTISERQSVS